VRRATRIAVDSDSGARVESAGFEARCLQHEIDHLDGVLFLDRVDSLARDVFRRKTYR
jgi:peptide deformylase